MKKINLVFPFILTVVVLFVILTPFDSQSKSGTGFYSGGHDSLLFDGQYGNSFLNGTCVCKAKVKKCDGEARGYRLRLDVSEICGQKETTYTAVKSILAEGDEVLVGDEYEIYTADGGKLKLQLENGIIMHFAEKTKIKLSNDYCCKKYIEYTLVKGTVCFEAQGHEGTEVSCNTRNSIFNDFLTLYTVETADSTDILKVYEGTVKATIKKPENSESTELGEKMKQLMGDFQSGKISADELGQKMKEYSDRIKYNAEHMQPASVEAGNKCTVTKSGITVEPIDVNAERWWEK